MGDNLLNPLILFFAMGVLAGAVRSDLKFPEALYEALSIFLLLAIGLKGGVEMSRSASLQIVPPIVATLTLGIAIPLIAFSILRGWGKFSRPDSAALAAHYGSVSAVTFAAALSFLSAKGIAHEDYATALMVILEIPAIAVGVMLAKSGTLHQREAWGRLLHDVFFGKSLFLLVGGLSIGWMCGADRIGAIQPLFSNLFYGALALFLLEMGLVVARRMGDLRKAGIFLTMFGMGMPLFSALLGAMAGTLVGLSVGGTMLLAVLSASASYIAAPAAVRMAIPEANPTYYLTASLGVTFPFNLVVGIPVAYWMATLMHAWMR